MVNNFFSMFMYMIEAFQNSDWAVALSGFLLAYFIWEVLLHKVFGKKEMKI